MPSFLFGALPLAAILAIRSGGWWVFGVVGALFGLRFLFWLAAPYNEFAYKAIRPRYETPQELAETLEPFRRSRILGPILRFGAATMGVHSREPDQDDKPRSSE